MLMKTKDGDSYLLKDRQTFATVAMIASFIGFALIFIYVVMIAVLVKKGTES